MPDLNHIILLLTFYDNYLQSGYSVTIPEHNYTDSTLDSPEYSPSTDRQTQRSQRNRQSVTAATYNSPQASVSGNGEIWVPPVSEARASFNDKQPLPMPNRCPAVERLEIT